MLHIGFLKSPMKTDLDIKPLIGLAGVLIMAMASEFNDQVSSAAIADVLGGLHLSHDPGTWIQSLYVSAEVMGMLLAPWSAMTFSSRRFVLFVISLNAVSTLLIPTTSSIPVIYGLRILQGLAGGLSIPLLMATALRFLSPPIRVYGLACYALTATFTPNMAQTITALWVDVVGWHFVFLQAIPLCVSAGMLAWYGLPQDPVLLDRLKRFDWRGFLLALIGLGSLSTMLQQGDRLDWFNSPAICVMALLSVVATPLLVINEWFHPLPLFKPQLLARRNLAYGLIALFLFLLIGLSASSLPTSYLQEVQGLRPIQMFPVTLTVAASQIVLLPLIAKLLDYEWADARIVSFVGLSFILIACIGSSFVNVTWNRDQFYVWQAFQALGQPLVVMSLLLMATNSIKAEEGQFGASLFNTPRAISEATGTWLIQLIDRRRGTLHTDRLWDQAGNHRYSILQANPLMPQHPTPLLPNGLERSSGSLSAFSKAIQQQATVMTISDSYLIIAGLTVCLMIVLMVLPVRTLPPRIQLAKK